MIVPTPAAPDEAVARTAATAPDRVMEIIAQNQLRLLRHEGIVRALVGNPATRPATLDNVTDFCVRSGLILADLPAFREARRRILGGAAGDANAAAEPAARAAEEEAAAVAELEKMGAVHGGSGEAPVGEGQAAGQPPLSVAAQMLKLRMRRKTD